MAGVPCLFLISIYIYMNIYRVPFIFDSSCVITPTTGLMAKPQPTVTRPLVHFGAGSHPLSYCTYGCCPSMNFGSPRTLTCPWLCSPGGNPHAPKEKPFLQALAEAYRQMAMLAPTIIIGDMNAAPTPADREGTGHTPGPCSPRHDQNARARGLDGQPRRPTIPLPPPNRCRPLPHRHMLR